jgi:hypothetical protein
MTSKKQIQANRKNAKKGGVKSKKGKEIAKMNALKHGILSNHLYVSNGTRLTDFKEFDTFRECFFEELQPVGVVETLLVDRLFATFWRLKRLHIAETGFIEKQLATHFIQFVFDKMEQHGSARTQEENSFFQLIRTRAGCDHVATFWKAVLETLKEKGGLPVSETMEENIYRELGGSSGYFKTQGFCTFNRAVRQKGMEPLSEEEEKGMNEWALSTAMEQHSLFAGLSEVLEWDEEDERKASEKAKMIPPIQELEKIQRYDAHLQRVMFQTLHELQRVQSQRLGRPAPLAAALDVTLNSENGFVS